jgi:hypothetical protein
VSFQGSGNPTIWRRKSENDMFLSILTTGAERRKACDFLNNHSKAAAFQSTLRTASNVFLTNRILMHLLI